MRKEHSPLPWSLGSEGMAIHSPKDLVCSLKICTDYERYKADAALIVHCVNHFTELREALELAAKRLHEEGFQHDAEQARAILEKTKGAV